MTKLVIAIIVIAAFGVPVFVEAKVFAGVQEGHDHNWNVLKRVLVTFLLLWGAGYLASIPLLGLGENPYGAPLQVAILSAVIAAPISIAGYVFGLRLGHKRRGE